MLQLLKQTKSFLTSSSQKRTIFLGILLIAIFLGISRKVNLTNQEIYKIFLDSNFIKVLEQIKRAH